MRHIKFQIIEDSMTGEPGILPNIFENWNGYIAGVSLGHDLIDHTTKETGEVFQELRALGANVFIHNFGSLDGKFLYPELHHVQRKGKILGYELESILNDQENIKDLPKAPKFHLNKKERGKFKMFWHFFEDSAIRSLGEDWDESWDGENPLSAWFEKNKGEVLNWLMYGYANAKRRYKGEYYHAYEMKSMIDKMLSKAWTSLEDSVNTGEEFTLSYSLENYSCKLSNRYGLI